MVKVPHGDWHCDRDGLFFLLRIVLLLFLPILALLLIVIVF